MGRDGFRIQYLRVGAVAIAVALIGTGVCSGAAAARPDDFYDVAAPGLSGAPGDVVRSEAVAVGLPAQATRIMYRSSDTHGAGKLVTGMYLNPVLPWPGPGARPLVVVAPGTQGQGDQCAPSKSFAVPTHYSPPADAMINWSVPGFVDTGSSRNLTDVSVP
jgi:hypothetical protein